MTNSILRAVILGVVLGAMFFFVPKLVLGIFVILVIVHILRFAFMGHGYSGRGYYGHGRCGYGSGFGYGRGGYNNGYGYGGGYDRECGCGPDQHFVPGGPHGHGPMHGHLSHMADKIRNMSEEEYTAFKTKMDKGFRYWGRNSEGYGNCGCGPKNEAGRESDSTTKNEETTK